MRAETLAVLTKFWGHNNYRGSQKQIIDRVLEGKDVIALLPTGGGKSICYQVPGLLQKGICIVVSPLVALIQDQVGALRARGIKAVALTGGIPIEEVGNILDNCIYGDYKFLYLSPERLQQKMVQERIREMDVNSIAIDEVHCISQWGYDFRPAYLQCALLRDLAPNAPMIALTATATDKVIKDIVKNLGIRGAPVFKDSFKRPNIAFSVKQTEDKLYHLKNLLAPIPDSSIIYVRSRKKCVQLSEFLTKNGFRSTFFHGGVPKAEKEKRLADWLDGKVPVIVATNAFGMGVDKPNVRLVVHYQIPDSLESYFQEAGRAGRDGLPSKAIMLINKEDRKVAKLQFLTALPKIHFLKKLYVQLNNYFQIPYGEVPMETFPLSFNAFCDQYALDTNKAYQGLKLLDRHSVIAISDNFSQKSFLRFSASKQGIFEYFEKHPEHQTVIQAILRTYGGITDYETKISPYLISKKTGMAESRLTKLLNQLHTDGIVEYRYVDSDLEITFLVPREDARTINTFARKVTSLHKVKEQNLQSMLNFVNNVNLCRSSFLLHYFGENESGKCGKCDVCIEKPVSPTKEGKDKIIGILYGNPLSSRKLMAATGMEERLLLHTLQSLLADEVIELNSKNEYALAKK